MPERYEHTDAPSYSVQSAIQKYTFASKFISNKIILDIACGIGYGANIMKNSEFSAFIVAGDNYLPGLHYGKTVYSKEINFCNVDILHLPFRDSFFDVIVSFETLEHLKDLERYLKELKRILKNGGILICSTPNRNFTQRVGIKNEFHIREYTHDELLELLNPHFKNIKSYGQLETASEILYRFPFIFKIYHMFRPILARIFKVRDPQVMITKSLNPKFAVKEFWSSSAYLIFVAEK